MKIKNVGSLFLYKGKLDNLTGTGHTAYLLILVDCLIQLKDEIPGTIKIIHQHCGRGTVWWSKKHRVNLYP